MNPHEKTIRLGAVILAFAVLLRIAGTGLPDAVISLLSSQEFLSAMLFCSTGRVVRGENLQNTLPTEASLPLQTEPTEPVQVLNPVPPEDLPAFAPEDAALVEVNSVCGYQTDLPAWLEKPLQWDLTQKGPSVLIVHSHGSESYQPDGSYTESSSYRTVDLAHNMISVGDRLVQVLEAAGIGVVHDRNIHDVPSYSNAYANSRESVRAYLQQYPTICLVLDLHRDSVADAAGQQLHLTTQLGGSTSAQLMMVVGSDAGGLEHPDWSENMALAVKLHAQLEKNTPGICRAISFRSQRFNQDLSPGALIVEVGSAGNTRQEALLAVEQLGKAIIDLCRGTKGAASK